MWIEAYNRPFQLFTDSRSRIFQYKFLNNILVNNFWLKKWGIQENSICTFCKQETETQVHIFWDCSVVTHFWSEIQCWLKSKNLNATLSKVIIFYGSSEEVELVNILVILAKQFIQFIRSTCKASNLNKLAFEKFFKQFLNMTSCNLQNLG